MEILDAWKSRIQSIIFLNSQQKNDNFAFWATNTMEVKVWDKSLEEDSNDIELDDGSLSAKSGPGYGF